MTKHSNRLIHETSPYLLQHAHNPVDWYPWGEEALALARERNVPILVSIGYSACHWCHVMERESFANEETAAIMNKHFVNIKIDREERPDLDHIYMDAVQAMTGSGGWPLNVFLTPDARPFYGGTYFPPRPIAGRPSWNDLLIGVSEAFKSRHEEIDQQAEQLTAHLRQANAFGLQKAEPAQEFAPDDARLAYEAIMAQADRQWGGFGRAPKFPQTLVIRFLLHYYWYTKKEDALDQACLSLDKMIAGGLYDQVGGGFARYSTDTEWLVPHFEKMLYDNALLIYAISEAFQLTRNSRYESVLRETIDFVNREFRQPGGGFYSALDADSEGEEGKFYVWSLAEIESVLGKDAGRFAEYYDITEKGNWEGKNILRVSLPLTDFAAGRGLDPQELETQLESGKKRLLAAREQRVRPRLDDKCLLGWNAMMVTAYLKAGSALDDAAIRQQGLEVLDWLRANLAAGDSGYAHSWKGERSVAPAFLDDYAQLIEALILAQEVTADPAWLQEARQLAAYVVDGFSDEEGLFFYYTNTNQTDVIIRKKEIYDGATPSGNALMAINLYRLGVLFGLPAWIRRSEQMLGAIKPTVTRYPTSFGLWALLMQARGYGIAEIALIGENFDNLQREFLLTFTPLSVFQPAPRAHKGFPLLEGKPETARPLLYLCRNYSCQNPVTELDALIRQLEVV